MDAEIDGMSDLVTLTIDGVQTSVPKGTLVVDAAKMIQNDIPVFCYHPKLEPVGMCRMCLVEIGLPMRDRATGEILKNEDGTPRLNFRGLETACTVEVSEGMVVLGATERVVASRESVVEFLLTSHPLDCPVCDKGGECPLQNLTMAHGKGTSRMSFGDKLKMDKHVPLGDLIFLDRERCIQCARCIRFQDEIVDDPVIHFHSRGRDLEIVTMSEPGFDSIWSGNTTDICPVGALTTADFRFGARPWELTSVATICPHCPVGCNMTLSTRREAISGGRSVIKRVMPRQNEMVNEIWICDKGRFGHHFADAPERLKTPLLRKNGELVEASWEEALDFVSGELQRHNRSIAGLTSGKLSNEDLFQFQKLLRQGLGSDDVDLARRRSGGGEIVSQVGIAAGSDIGELASGDAIVVVASDLHQEAPVWWMRVKQAAERGASIIVLNLRSTRLDKHAKQILRYRPGEALETVRQLVSLAQVEIDASTGNPLAEAAETLVNANNLVAFYGSEGLTSAEMDTLAKLLGNLLLIKNGDGHVGRKNNGLVPVWPDNNSQGAWDMGIHPAYGPGYHSLAEPGRDGEAIVTAVADGGLSALYVMGADPIGDGLMAGRGGLKLLVVQELFMTRTANEADVVFPAQSWAEREGTYTSGERRVQRFYPGIPPIGQSKPDWLILAHVGERVGMDKPASTASLMFQEITRAVPQYREMDYRVLSLSEKQWPDVGGEDLYYGGNAYENRSGLGQQWSVKSESEDVERFETPDIADQRSDRLKLMGTTALYARSARLKHSQVLATRFSPPEVMLHPSDAADARIGDGERIALAMDGRETEVMVRVVEDLPTGLALVSGIKTPPGLVEADVRKLEEVEGEIA
jgi:NADH-quinone oxidoreductase subunit G